VIFVEYRQRVFYIFLQEQHLSRVDNRESLASSEYRQNLHGQNFFCTDDIEVQIFDNIFDDMVQLEKTT
jgi:hypothetical protein